MDFASGTTWRLGYRPALDGIRGVAVLLVVLAHAALLRNAGGVGVLMFFVLSGFLITSLLLREHTETGRIDFRAFYRRRFARLLPALLATSAAIAIYLTLTGHEERLLPDVGGALSYIGNWLQIAGVKMVLTSHTWSLAVEEQFYAIWPLSLMLLLRLPRTAWIVGGLVVVSLAWTVVLDDVLGATSPRTTRGLDSVAPALLAGCALAFVLQTHPTLSAGVPGLVAGAVSIAIPIGILAVGGSSSGILEATTLGTVLLIASTHGARSGLLTWAPLRYVGRISYGLYLWHFPVFAVLRSPAILEIVAAFAVAIASYHLLEAPILHRYGRARSRPPGAARAPSSGVVTVGE